VWLYHMHEHCGADAEGEGEDKRGVNEQSQSVNHRSEMDTVRLSKTSNEQMNGVVHGWSVDCSHDCAFPRLSFNVCLI
jgi:hypothetical protein